MASDSNRGDARSGGIVRRTLAVVCPWYVLWRLKQLATNPEPEPQDMDEWDRGYQRAMSEIRLNLGLEDWS